MSEAPRFLVCGAGAIGSVFAARLARDCPVAVVARGARLDAIRRDRIQVTGATEARVRLPAFAPDDDFAAFRPDFALVTVKAYDTRAAAEALRRLGRRTVRVSVQNGLGNEEALAAGGQPVIGAVNNNGATLARSGEVFHAGVGEVLLGRFSDCPRAAVGRLAAALRAAGFPCLETPDILGALWRKAILNAAVNPITALLGLRTGELLADRGREVVARRIVEEACRVAASGGAAIPAAVILEDIRRVAAATPENKSSMLQDLERGRGTEVGAINGIIARRGRSAGIPTPWNDLMLRLIRSRESRPGR